MLMQRIHLLSTCCSSCWKICSEAREKDLRGQLSKMERILKLGELCRKLEKEREKVLPFHTLDEAVPIPALPSYQAVQASKKNAGEFEAMMIPILSMSRGIWSRKYCRSFR